MYNSNVTTVCYKSLPKIEGDWDFVILDEVHNLTLTQSIFFKNKNVSAVLGLTATKPKELNKIQIFQELSLSVIYEITLDEAVDLGVVAPYKITVVTVPLNKIDKCVKGGKKEAPFYTTEERTNSYYIKVDKDPTITKTKHFYMARMRFIYNLQSKTEAAKLLLSNIPEDKRVVIFSGGIDQANTISNCRFHTGVTSECYDLFVNQQVNQLSCVNSLNEGHNLPMVDIGLVVQLNSKDRNLIQRLGRIIRYRPGHVGQFIILVAENTIDMKWVREATAELNPERISYVSLNEVITSGINQLIFKTGSHGV